MTQNEFSKLIKPKIESCKLKEVNNMFDFIEQPTLRRKLTKSLNEAVFVKNITEMLSINFSDAHPLNEIQILHYSSIYEAIIDYVLEKYFSNEIKDLLIRAKFIKHDINKNISIKKETISLALYSVKNENRKLYDNKFEDRVKRIIELGIDISNIKDKLIRIYKYRNNIHILNASERNIKFTKKSVEEFCDNSLLRNFCSEIKRTILLINCQA